ncbi:hypothetical protein Zmor_010238 [Zophobas morio]|uniref:Uncharacterized protein n=1 Tax=Zophobas morio TaxID=2755281 RepID=A0AA38INH5_9CUCU|nr:hypothetical protein Zmor_010238 [Zophobas morio]
MVYAEEVKGFCQLLMKCQSNAGLSLPGLDRDFDALNFDENSKYKEYFLCVLKKVRAVSESDKVDKEVIARIFHASDLRGDELEEIVDCVVEKDTPEDTALQFRKCIAKHIYSLLYCYLL